MPATAAPLSRPVRTVLERLLTQHSVTGDEHRTARHRAARLGLVADTPTGWDAQLTPDGRDAILRYWAARPCRVLTSSAGDVCGEASAVVFVTSSPLGSVVDFDPRCAAHRTPGAGSGNVGRVLDLHHTA
ncbi:hypothetical protein [Kitasatospora viridis]|uniref:Uncharacterized protein n=1 Tax=Kitasatospora viridis TaxID=281105 RepID=A0A561SA86_9ACTN|nr:hypothetical protein [Kitasatospora viridis]TWF71715.1 hypothetical protein FHX73_1886 [Kitasatospora viridis]